ncbi:MAG: hypothetical protein EOP04_08470 [Proteobacteria bacterium]|nr:MAG: hypothetical protein EOP04_08470 [Pseudomonadota bacterium]
MSWIRFVHLSDIHFGRPGQKGAYDLDSHLRNELEADLVRIVKKFGTFKGVLVTGDIAFSGEVKQYDTAKEWLDKICRILGCPDHSVWTVPGNHDVVRSYFRKSKPTRDFHSKVRSIDPSKVDAELSEAMQDNELGPGLLASTSAYNNFAAPYGCQVEPFKPYWSFDFDLNDGSKLRVRGLTSTIISDNMDDSGAHKLVLGTAQVNLMRETGVAHMTLCHHPPSWLIDQDVVERKLRALASIQLYGHKHNQVLEQIGNTVRITAGAVHPDRGGFEWRPRYNIISTMVEGVDTRRKLAVQVDARVWDESAQKFVADYYDGSESQIFSLALDDWTMPQAVEEESSLVLTEIQSYQAVAEVLMEEKIQVLGESVMNPIRRFAYRFLNLPYHKQVEVAQKFGLFEDDDRTIYGSDLFSRFLERANRNQVAADFWEAVEKEYSDPSSSNPFH